MPSSPEFRLELVRHPESPAGAVRAVHASVRRAADGALAVVFAIEGDIAAVHVPAPKPPRFADRLWEHTCCEIFVARKDAADYHEFNLSPSGEWAVYAFRRYRERAGPDATGLAPRMSVRRSAGALELEAAIRLDLLSDR